MPNDTIITVENLGKKYRIRHQQAERYTALRDVIATRAAAPLRALKRKLESRKQKTGNGTSSGISNSYFNLRNSTEDFCSSDDRNTPNLLVTGAALILEIGYVTEKEFSRTSLAFVVSIKTEKAQELIRLSTTPISGFALKPMGKSGYIRLTIDKLPLTAGQYLVDIGIADPNVEMLFNLEAALALDVQPRDIYGSGIALDQRRGLFVVPHSWDHFPNSDISAIGSS